VKSLPSVAGKERLTYIELPAELRRLFASQTDKDAKYF
jgi:hypothetical protein